MAAAATTLPVVYASFNPADYSQQRSKQRKQQQQQPFDASLLCQKLEAHKREQDALRRRRQQERQSQQQSQSKSRNAGHFVPKSAAIQFAATTTPLQKDGVSTHKANRKATSKENRIPSSSLPVVVSKKVLVTQDVTLPSREVLAETNINMPSHKASPHLLSSSYPSQQDQDVVAPEGGEVRRSKSITDQHRSGYMPGDAARRNKVNPNGAIFSGPGKRQSCIATATSYRAPPPRHPHDPPARDPWGSLLANPSATAATAAAERSGTGTPKSRDSSDQVRPRLSHDRPNWCQESQSGDDAKHILQLPGLMHRKAKDVVASAFVGEREVAPKRNGSGGEGISETLINDAVRIIKKEEKDKRRVSIMGIFKRA